MRSLPHKKQSRENADRKQDVERPASHVHPEISDGFRGVPRKSANQSHGHGHSGRGGDEVLDRESSHLNKITNRRLGRVRLPVRVRHEADGGIERQVGRHGRGVLRSTACAENCTGLNGKCPCHRCSRYTKIKLNKLSEIVDAAYCTQRLLLVLADPAEAIDQPLQGVEDGMKKRSLTLEDFIHITSPGAS